MFDFPLDKYTYYIATKVDGTPYKVIATTTFAGKRVRGVATCSKHDEFNLELGKEFAAARANLKVAERRYKLATRKCDIAIDKMYEAEKYFDKMRNYCTDSSQALKEALNKLAAIEDEVK